jgi:hypothetical protein
LLSGIIGKINRINPEDLMNSSIDTQLVKTAISDFPKFYLKDDSRLEVLAYVVMPTNTSVFLRHQYGYFLQYTEKVTETQSKMKCFELDDIEALVSWFEKNQDIIQVVSLDFPEIIASLKEKIDKDNQLMLA